MADKLDIKALIDEFIHDSEFVDIRKFLESKKIIYDELLLEEIIDYLADKEVREAS